MKKILLIAIVATGLFATEAKYPKFDPMTYDGYIKLIEAEKAKEEHIRLCKKCIKYAKDFEKNNDLEKEPCKKKTLEAYKARIRCHCGEVLESQKDK